jgi:hypothetical protein
METRLVSCLWESKVDHLLRKSLAYYLILIDRCLDKFKRWFQYISTELLMLLVSNSLELLSIYVRYCDLCSINARRCSLVWDLSTEIEGLHYNIKF